MKLFPNRPIFRVLAGTAPLVAAAVIVASTAWAQSDPPKKEERERERKTERSAPAPAGQQQRSSQSTPAPAPSQPAPAPRPARPAYTQPANTQPANTPPAYTPPAPQTSRPSQPAYTPPAAPTPRPSQPAYVPPAQTPRPSAPQAAPAEAQPGRQTPRVTNTPAMRPVYTAPPSAAVASRTPTGASVLNNEGSRSVVQQLNTSRAGMQGINARAVPQGAVTVHPTGHVTIATANGGSYGLRPNGTVASISAQGRAVNFRPDGRVAAIHTPTLDVVRGVHGERVIRTVRPDHTILVSNGPRNGYLERTVVVRNQTVIQRTYVVNGVVSTRAFVSYPYRGMVVPMYVPRVYYAPAFYGWAFYPWSTPVVFSWGWRRDPWVGFYAGYYQPYPVYPGPNAWLTDYYLSQTLAASYAAQNQAPPLPGYGPDPNAPAPTGPQAGEVYAPADTPITPALRDAIAAEVSRQLAYENAVASGQAQPTVQQLRNALQPGRVFVVASNLQVPTADGQTCDLTPADVLQMNNAPSDDATSAILTVASSKKLDCPAGMDVAVQMTDLAEMQNNMRAQMDAGLEALHSSQGQNGLPAAPAAAMAAPSRPALDVPLPPDPNVTGLLDAQQQDAQNAELATVQAVAATN